MRQNAVALPLKVYPIGTAPGARGCFDENELDLVHRRVHFHANKGSGGHVDKVVTITLQRIAMIALLRAMIEAPTIVIGFGDATTATFRSTAMQTALHDAYLRGGYLAAPPCSSFHEKGLSADGYFWTDRERNVMREHGFYDLLPQDPPHMTYGVRG